MDAETILQKMEHHHYWDARITSMICNQFADELTLIHEGRVKYKFIRCYKMEFYHDTAYEKDKSYSEATIGQIPYFIQNISINITKENEHEFYDTVIDAFPMRLNILSKDILVIEES